MKLSELRPCDNCGGKIAPTFYVVRVSLALFDPRATNTQLGLVQMFGGAGNGALALAEIMGPTPDVVQIAGDKKKELRTELFICQDCALMKPVNLGELLSKREEATPRDQQDQPA